MKNERATPYLCVYLLLCHNEKILFSLRQNTGYADGMYSLPAGHVDKNESALEAIVRESFEEIGIRLKKENIKLVHTMHRLHERENIDLFFTCDTWENEVINKEPHKCGGLIFCAKDFPPQPIVPYVAHVLNCLDRNIIFSELGW